MLRTALACIAVLALVAPVSAETREEKAEKYIKQLDAKDAKARATAAEELGKLAELQSKLGKPAVKQLVKLLADKDAGVRAAAAGAACRIDEPKEVVPAVVKMLKDEKDDKVKLAAVQGLAIMGESAKEAVPTVREVAAEARKAMNNRLGQACRTTLDSLQARMKKN